MTSPTGVPATTASIWAWGRTAHAAARATTRSRTCGARARSPAATGGRGDDVADGRAGDDRIDLGVGSNRARGGPGDDTIAVMWGSTPQPLVQRVSCGTGRDRVSQLFRNDFAEDDCETVVIAEFHEL